LDHGLSGIILSVWTLHWFGWMHAWNNIGNAAVYPRPPSLDGIKIYNSISSKPEETEVTLHMGSENLEREC
jgi:hypothetical protein